MYMLASALLRKNAKYVSKARNWCCVRVILYLYIRNLENSRLKLAFGTQ